MQDGVGIADLFRGWDAAYLDGQISAPGGASFSAPMTPISGEDHEG